jgi:hypothetical protein
VVDGTSPFAELPRASAVESSEDKGLGIARRVGCVAAESKSRGNRGRERATGAVIVERLDETSVKDAHPFWADEDVRNVHR